MIDKAYIQKLVEEITEGTSIFLTKLDIDNLGKISVYLDSDTNLTIDDCVKVSRCVISWYRKSFNKCQTVS